MSDQRGHGARAGDVPSSVPLISDREPGKLTVRRLTLKLPTAPDIGAAAQEQYAIRANGAVMSFATKRGIRGLRYGSFPAVRMTWQTRYPETLNTNLGCKQAPVGAGTVDTPQPLASGDVLSVEDHEPGVPQERLAGVECELAARPHLSPTL